MSEAQKRLEAESLSDDADEACGLDAQTETAGELIAVAFVVRTRGVRGEVVAELLTDFPERFEGLERLIAVSPEGERKVLTVQEHWFQNDRIVLKFEGYDSPEEAKALVGQELAVPEAEAVELEDDEFYDWQLEGCRVETIGGAEVGEVEEVLHTGGDAPVLVIRGAGGREHLVPLVESICTEIDVERKRIRVDAPEGLLELEH